VQEQRAGFIAWRDLQAELAGDVFLVVAVPVCVVEQRRAGGEKPSDFSLPALTA
jgi:hypothetical protein